VTDIYKFAAQTALRFPSPRGGDLTVEQLFQLPLQSKTGFDLDNVAKLVNTELKAVDEESFVPTAKTSPDKARLSAAMAIVKDVIDTKVAENAAAATKRERQEEIRRIRDLIVQKKDEKLAGSSLEELEAKLKSLSESA
jgi:hypothetical protein